MSNFQSFSLERVREGTWFPTIVLLFFELEFCMIMVHDVWESLLDETKLIDIKFRLQASGCDGLE